MRTRGPEPTCRDKPRVAVPSNARLDGRFALRVANTNHRTVPADFNLLVDTSCGWVAIFHRWTS